MDIKTKQKLIRKGIQYWILNVEHPLRINKILKKIDSCILNYGYCYDCPLSLYTRFTCLESSSCYMRFINNPTLENAITMTELLVKVYKNK